MTTLTLLSIALGSVLLECLLLVRGFQNKLWSRFPIFYSYIAVVLVETVVLTPIYFLNYSRYQRLYWASLFFDVIIGSLVVLEIFRITLRWYPGTSRMARNALFFIFALTAAKVIVYRANGTLAWLADVPVELERHLRIVQAFAIVAIVAVLLLYAIPISRNLKGLLLGYSLFVGCSVIDLSLVSYLGAAFDRAWLIVQPFSYCFFLLIWVVALWSAAPEPIPAPPSDKDYSDLASGTSRELGKLNFDLRKAPRR
jgi:hypothetical protein